MTASGLPLQTDSIIGMVDVLRIVVSLIILLGATYGLLWAYQRRYGKLPPGFTDRSRDKGAPLELVSRLRLSPRTQVYVVRRGEQEFLVTESAGSATTLPLNASENNDSNETCRP